MKDSEQRASVLHVCSSRRKRQGRCNLSPILPLADNSACYETRANRPWGGNLLLICDLEQLDIGRFSSQHVASLFSKVGKAITLP